MSEGDKYIGKTIADLQAEHDLDQVRQLHRQMDEVEQRIKALNEKHGISPEMMPKTRLIVEPFPFIQILLGVSASMIFFFAMMSFFLN
jgi:hypothetical protein